MHGAADRRTPHPVSRGTLVPLITCSEHGSARNGAHVELSSVVVGVVERGARRWIVPSVRRGALSQRRSRRLGHRSVDCSSP